MDMIRWSDQTHICRDQETFQVTPEMSRMGAIHTRRGIKEVHNGSRWQEEEKGRQAGSNTQRQADKGGEEARVLPRAGGSKDKDNKLRIVVL